MKKFFMDAINKAFNAFLNIDPDSRERLRNLEGKAVTIELLPFHYLLQVVVREQSAIIQENEVLIPDVKIRGTPLQLASLVFTQNTRQQFFAEDVTIEGDAEIGQQVIGLFDELTIDWGEQLAGLIGDVSAHHLGKMTAGIRQWAKHLDESFSADISEYVQEELALLPNKEILKNYYTDIDNLRMDVDRAEARIKLLQEALTQTETDSQHGEVHCQGPDKDPKLNEGIS